MMLLMPDCKRIGLGVRVACGAVVMLLVAGCQRDISGAYLASDQNTVCWLQLVRTPDDRLTGQLIVSALNADGRIDQDSVSLTGAVDGEDVSLAGSRFLGLQGVTFSGTLRGDTVTLAFVSQTGAEVIPLTFTRSSVSAYQLRVSALNARSQSIVKAKEEVQRAAQLNQARANFLAEIDQTIASMGRFDSEADVHLARFPAVEQRYEAITAKMAGDVGRESDLAGNPNASVARGQLCVAVTQGPIATDQLHLQGQSLESTLEVNIKPIADKLANLEEGCRTLAYNTDKLGAAQNQEDSAACGRLTAAAIPFRQKYDAVAAGLAHLERVYQVEHGKQQELLREAERLR